MDSAKKPWQSKTMVLNALFGLAAALSLFLPAQAGVVKSLLEAHPAEIGMIWSLLNIALRAITKEKVSLAD